MKVSLDKSTRIHIIKGKRVKTTMELMSIKVDVYHTDLQENAKSIIRNCAGSKDTENGLTYIEDELNKVKVTLKVDKDCLKIVRTSEATTTINCDLKNVTEAIVETVEGKVIFEVQTLSLVIKRFEIKAVYKLFQNGMCIGEHSYRCLIKEGSHE